MPLIKLLSFVFCLLYVLVITSTPGLAQTERLKSKVILDTDIGDDIDDAFALALAMRSPEIDIIGITTVWGDTLLRARLVQRFLKENDFAPVPIAIGSATKSEVAFSQADWAKNSLLSMRSQNAVSFLLEQAKKYPGEISLIALGPMTNIGAAITQDPEGFKNFKQVILMGGSIYRGYGDLGYTPNRGAQPEYNIYTDVAAAQKLFSSRVPVFMLPLDSTQIMLDEVKRNILFSTGTKMSNALTALYYQWAKRNRLLTPVLFDVLPVAYLIDPKLCPMTALHITIENKGMTKVEKGLPPNAHVCLESDPEKLFHFLLPRLIASSPLS